MTSAPVRIDPGTTVGPYVVERWLAQGLQSVLYLARDASGERVALKMLLSELTTPAARARLPREARALSGVDHPGVVRVLGSGEHEGAPWMAMDFVRGTDLARLVAERGPLGVTVGLNLAVQLAEALSAAHDAGVVHRDLMPSNVMVTPEGRVVLVDFGIVKRRAEGREGDPSPDTPAAAAYLSPEQIEHGLADERSDIWGAGCVLYEMVTGVPPFGRGGPATAEAILEGEPEYPPGLPVAVESIVAACLRKSSFARVASARELVSLLRDAHAEARTKRASRRPSSPPASSSRMQAARVTSPVPGRPPSSAMRVAVARGRIKGTAIRAGVAWFAEMYGEPGLARIVELATPDLAAVLRKDDPAFGIIASGWYDTYLVGELLGLLEDVASPADPVAFASKVAEAIAKDNVGGVYRALFRLVASPPLLEANAQRVWRTYVDEGTLAVSLQGPGSFESRIRGWSRHHPGVCRMIRSMIESLLRAVGYRGLVVERTRCVAQGDPHCAFDGTWLP